MSFIVWSVDEIRKMVELSDIVYDRAKKLETQVGKKLYEGLMATLDLKGSSEAAVKFIELQHMYSMPIAVLDDNDTWNVNREFVEHLLRSIDPNIDLSKVIREAEPDQSKHIGRTRFRLGGAWGEIISFYILNEPLPKITIILYLIHIASYITTFTTVTIPEIYTGSEEFLKLIGGADTKRGMLEFLTRLLRRRYISEDQYTSAIEAVNKRHELPYESLKEELERYESRAVMAEYISKGISAIIVKLQEILDKYGDKPIPREEVASVVGEVYTITRGLEIALDEYRNMLTKLNDLLTTSGRTISSEKVRRIMEELTKD